MSNPVLVTTGLPQLPPGWTEHVGPGGQPYYYHAQTQQSTYIRPAIPIPSVPATTVPSNQKPEKPVVKTPIPGTDWLRVKTTEGNVFYSHKVKKQSFWIVPEEIKDALARLEQEEREHFEKAKAVDQEQMEEIERVKADIQELVKRKAENAPSQDSVPTKKQRISTKDDEGGSDSDEDDDEEEEEEEEWEREAAAQLAAEAEAEQARREEEERREREEQAKKTQLHMPERVDLSLEEAKALFKTLLREKDINPLHPWDTSLPLFVNDPRYVLLPSVAARRDAFDEYCRERARELRQKSVKQESTPSNPKAEFDKLLADEVKSTRASWTDFRRTWKKDRRFFGWGRDDREREKRFREFLKDLGEKKRAAAQKAEADFFKMLSEKGTSSEKSAWKGVKKQFVNDPRYDAVGSSSLREELFQTFVKGKAGVATEQVPIREETGTRVEEELDEGEKQSRRKERKERAVREREEKILAERRRLDAEINRSRQGVTMEEGEREFRTMLVDAIRDAKLSWDEALLQLQRDPRMQHSPLPLNQQLHLFHSHQSHLRTKHLNGLYALFEAHAPTLATSFSTLPVSSLLTSAPSSRLGYDVGMLENEFKKWNRERTQRARKEFDEMLSENLFVEFWGKLRKIGGEGVEGGVRADGDGDDDEGVGGGGKVDMKALAKNVDVEEMEKVLKNDKRYIMFDHIPEERESWLREYLSKLSAPQLSVHLPQRSS
ncbi:hypothetical protein AX16_003180 [Volvariella volvacea WC 439]|nr:hypothetical protein AX16_003180 [Volvariella volvacea WC 439]